MTEMENSLRHIEKLLWAVQEEFGECPTWQPLIENARRQLDALHLCYWFQDVPK